MKMDLLLVQSLCLDVQSFWIDKAKYDDAERSVHIALSKIDRSDGSILPKNDQTLTADPAKRKKRSRKKKPSKIQDKPIDLYKLVGDTCLQASNLLVSQSQHIIRVTEEKQKENKEPNEKPMKTKPPKAKISRPSNTKYKSAISQKSKLGLTPYQGNKRCFGEYACNRCNRKWKSGYSWANMGQQCKRCMRMIYPYKQIRLQKQDGVMRPGMAEHDTDKCEMCNQINGDCRY